MTAAQPSRRSWIAWLNAFGSSLSTSIVPTTLFPSASNTGTMISERVVPNAVKYRGSAETSPTLTLGLSAMAALVSPLVSGKVCTRSAPGYVSCQSSCGIYVVEADPPVVGGTAYEDSDFLQCSLSILRCGNDAFEIREERVAAGIHGFNIAKRLIFFHET